MVPWGRGQADAGTLLTALTQELPLVIPSGTQPLPAAPSAQHCDAPGTPHFQRTERGHRRPPGLWAGLPCRAGGWAAAPQAPRAFIPPWASQTLTLPTEPLAQPRASGSLDIHLLAAVLCKHSFERQQKREEGGVSGQLCTQRGRW